MKVHIGADVDSGMVHSVSVTPADVADTREFPNLVREKDKAVFGDRGYVSKERKRSARKDGVHWGVLLKARPKEKISSSARKKNRKLASIRSRVEHIFRVMKRASVRSSNVCYKN